MYAIMIIPNAIHFTYVKRFGSVADETFHR